MMQSKIQYAIGLMILFIACGNQAQYNHKKNNALTIRNPSEDLPEIISLPGRRVTIPKSAKGSVYANADVVTVIHNGKKSKGLLPGDTVEMSGWYKWFQLRNIKGTKNQPIVFTNKGLVTAGSVSAYTFIMEGEHFKLLGNGDPAYKYGYKLGARDTSTTVLQLGNSSNTEVAHVEVYGGAIGIQANYGKGKMMYNNYWHHNYLHDLGNKKRSNGRSEAFYIGYTKGNATAIQVNCRIENNIIENVTGDGIQVNWGSYLIKDNIIRNFATASLPSHRSAIVLGGRVKAIVEGNFVQGGRGKAMEIFADSADVQNNTFQDIDLTATSAEDLVYVNSKICNSERKMWINFSNNTFTNSTPNRKYIFIAAKDTAYSKGIFANNKGLSRNSAAIMDNDVFAAHKK